MVRTLDALRGLAAIIVVIFHYQNMSWIGPVPYSNYLKSIYTFGWIFVDFFFVLSGFIFYSKYFDLISRGKITIQTFVMLRLSRLFPLLLVTHILATLLNAFIFSKTGKFYIHNDNDIFAFFAHLLFIQAGFGFIGYGFNAPDWSIGIEFWMYIAFFVLTTSYKERKILPLVIFVLALAIQNHYQNSDFLRGFEGFMLGGLISNLVISEKYKEYVGVILFFLGLSLLVLIDLSMRIELPNLVRYHKLLFITVVSPTLILGVVNSSYVQKILSPLQELGKISYSIYLLHWPLQMFIYTCAISLGIQFKSTSIIFFTYLFALLSLGVISFHYLEAPVQKFIRLKFEDRNFLGKDHK